MKRFQSVEKGDAGAIRLEAHLDGKIQYDDRGYTVLHAAASKGWLEGVKSILENHILDVDVVDGNECGQSPLYIAALHGRSDVVRVLLSFEANANLADDSYAQTPLHMASLHGFPEVVALLLDGGANIEAKDSDRKSTPLLLAAHQSKMSVVKLLIDRGANVSVQDSFGHTYQFMLERNKKNPTFGKA